MAAGREVLMSQSMISHVSDTAIWVAHFRAEETRRADALFQDPLATRLTGSKGKEIARQMAAEQFTAWSVVIRTCIIDAYIRELIASQGVDLIVNLGAGLDTRPYRMDLPASLRWVEVDFPHLIEFKNRTLQEEKPRCQLSRVSLDLSNRPARLQFLSEACASADRVLVLMEGVVPYLPATEVALLAADFRAQKQIQFWIVDYFSPTVMSFFTRGRWQRQLKNAPFQFMPKDWFQFFSQNGWSPREIRYLTIESAKLGRELPLPFWAKWIPSLLPAKQREAIQKFSAYVLLEPNKKE
jgi:methyltransferase (TIGR00027 family)